jgi:hypothetical protein
MELKPAKGLKVKVEANREAVFGEESVQINKISLPNGSSRNGIMTGTVLAGYCEVDMPSLDGKKHWYPVDGLLGEKGEKIVEEEIELPEETDDFTGPEESEDDEE